MCVNSYFKQMQSDRRMNRTAGANLFRRRDGGHEMELSKNEKIALVSGTNFMETNPVPKKNIPALVMSDGPHGLRKQIGTGDNGIAQSEPATAFPTAVTVASSWNPGNSRAMGRAIAEECRHYGVHMLLGPGCNIKRNPLCGRNFEYYSEDPVLSGEMAAALVQGLQDNGTAACVKHFALNNSENYRFMGDSVCDERAMREIYLKSFERVIRKAEPAAVMCAYNKVNGTYCSENSFLLNDVLRKEWGFRGLVMTDWGAMHDRKRSVISGLDLEMPGDVAWCRQQLAEGLEDGTLQEDVLDTAARRVLDAVDQWSRGSSPCKADFDAHAALAADIAADSAVLLENDGTLPLDPADELLIIGDLFFKMRYQGSGSSMISPAGMIDHAGALEKRGIRYRALRGYRENDEAAQPELITEAVAAAADAKRVIIYAGLTDWVESEGCDREHMRLPDGQLALIGAILEAGIRPVIVLFGGSVVEVPFSGRVRAILHMFLPGESGGEAAARLLFGEAEPAGRLSETWPLSYSDVPFSEEFGKHRHEIYRESTLVGYRYYETADVPVRYPFGYGLSYTEFAWSDMKLSLDGNELTVSCTVRNTGKRDGAEVVQLYVKAPGKAVPRPGRELKAFRKVYLRAGESVNAVMTFPVQDLCFWCCEKKRPVLEDGAYSFLLCSDSHSVRLSEEMEISGEKLPRQIADDLYSVYSSGRLDGLTDQMYEKLLGRPLPQDGPLLPVTLDSRFSDMKQTFFGRILYSAVLSVAAKQKRAADRLPEGPERDNRLKGALFLKRILDSNSLQSMGMCAGKQISHSMISGFAALANGHILQGIKLCLTKDRAPALPVDEEE
ncbi:MAG: glycosyl hydrolase [Clostridiales bacterium]|nr:glycosyl hydrolase [Clostridiales bacterium]